MKLAAISHLCQRHRSVVRGVVLLAIGFSVTPVTARAGEDDLPRITILIRSQSSHQEAAASLHDDLRAAGYDSVLIEMPTTGGKDPESQASHQLVASQPTIVATAGTKATSMALEALPEVPVVYFMVPNALDAPFVRDQEAFGHRCAGVTTDISPDERIDWLTTLYPSATTICVPASARSTLTASGLAVAAKRHNIKAVTLEATKDKFMPVIEAFGTLSCDAVLMLPDAQVYNSVTVQRLLLWGVRQKKPVLAFSPHVVKAGALAGQYCDNQAIGRQTARLIVRVIRGTDISSIGLQYPEHVNQAVNERTAELIAVVLDQRQMLPSTVYVGRR